MIRDVVRREGKIVLCLAAGLLAAALSWNLNVSLVLETREHPWMMALAGLATPGGAPFYVDFLNAAIWALWGAAGYAVAFRICFGRVVAWKIAFLYCCGMAVIAVGGLLAERNAISLSILLNCLLGGYVVVGIFLVRDWPTWRARTVEAV